MPTASAEAAVRFKPTADVPDFSPGFLEAVGRDNSLAFPLGKWKTDSPQKWHCKAWLGITIQGSSGIL